MDISGTWNGRPHQNGNCGSSRIAAKKRGTILVSLMPQNRWPIITTSVSGIRPEIWDQFKTAADARGLTHREAAEEAIRDLAVAFGNDGVDKWEPTSRSKAHSVRAHTDRWDEIHAIVEKTGFHQSVVIQTAMKRWLDKDQAGPVFGEPRNDLA
jgi:hypothetical protein